MSVAWGFKSLASRLADTPDAHTTSAADIGWRVAVDDPGPLEGGDPGGQRRGPGETLTNALVPIA
jgi:hypothetical protein